MAEPQLHELLAVEPDLRGQANKILAETQKVFQKDDLFRGTVVSYDPFDEADEHLKQSEEKKVGTTVPARLKFTFEKLVRYWDVVCQKERTNQEARADIKIGDQTIAEGVPAGMLLGLETKLGDLYKTIEHMPTLDIGIGWHEQPEYNKPYVFEADEDEVRIRTRKTQQPLQMAPATKEHPEQVTMVTKDIEVGKIKTKKFSGAVTSAEKAAILERLETMRRAVKKARQRANKQPVVKQKIGRSILDFVLGS